MTKQQIITLAEAKARGLKRYFTGKPCLRGHVCERYAGSNHCCECDLVKHRLFSSKNRERMREYSRKSFAKNIEINRARSRIFYYKNREKVRKQQNKIRAQAALALRVLIDLGIKI